MEGCCLAARSKKMPIRALPATEAELHAAAQCAQDLMFAWRIMACMGLSVEFPMIMEIGSKGAVDLCSNWPVGGRARHVPVKQLFLRDLKEAGILKIAHTSGGKGSCSNGRVPTAPAEPGKILSQGEQGEKQSKEKHKTYQAGAGLLLHIARWARQEALNAVRELASHMHEPAAKHMKAMRRRMHYLVPAPGRGCKLSMNLSLWPGSGVRRACAVWV